MAKDLSTIPSTSTGSEGDIDINQITNSGIDTDRDNFDTNKETTPDKGTPPPSSDTGKEDSPASDSTKDTKSSEDGDKGTDNNTNELQTILSSFNNDDLNDEDKALKSQLLEKYKGSAFNEKGDIIDENGTILASVDDIAASLDNDGSTLDKDGNLVDTDGKILKTKAELAAEDSVVNKLHSELEYEFLDENGKPKVYSDDAKGFEELSNDLATYKLEQFKSGFFNQNPELAEVSKHLLAGGTLDNFKAPIDYSKIDVKALSPEGKEKYIRDSFKAGGMADSRIDAMIKRIKDSNGLDEEAEAALADLTIRDKEAKKQRDLEYKASVDKRNQEVAKYWDEVEETITKGNLASLNVPENDKQAFLDYVSRPVDETGNSKEMLDSSKESIDQKLALAYIRYKGYKLDDLIDSRAKSKNAMSLRDRIKRSAKQKPTPANDANGITSGKETVPSINEMLP